MSKRHVLIVGHSHIASLIRAWEDAGKVSDQVDIEFLNLRDERYARRGKGDEGRLSPAEPNAIKRELLLADYCARAKKVDWVIFCINGNEHNNFGMFETPSRTFDNVISRINGFISSIYPAWLGLFLPCTHVPASLLFPPPPIESDEYIMRTRKLERIVRSVSIRNANDRLIFWEKQIEATRAVAAKFGLRMLELPGDVLSPSGFMADDCRGTDPSHGNNAYGGRILSHIAQSIGAIDNAVGVGQHQLNKSAHPYAGLPDYAYWRQSISETKCSDVDPVVDVPFKVTMSDKVATAGSCFAQHISKRLRENGFRFLVVEGREGEDAADGRGYDFSARYGNIYTARQMLQLFDRAFGYFKPLERAWPRREGGYCDPFRPRIEPEGFGSERAVLEDMRKHLAAVRKMFRQLDVLVFTLGLTECWVSKLDGAAFPVAPGVVGGEFDPEKHSFVNFGVADVVADLRAFIDKLRLVNPRSRVILTVSPVPLVATYEERHVLVSTTYSKAVLRVAAEEVARGSDSVFYFPSYEIITGNHAAGRYFDPDRRSVNGEGVDHVMRVFLGRVTDASAGKGGGGAGKADAALEAEIEALGEVLCDEEMLAC